LKQLRTFDNLAFLLQNSASAESLMYIVHTVFIRSYHKRRLLLLVRAI